MTDYDIEIKISADFWDNKYPYARIKLNKTTIFDQVVTKSVTIKKEVTAMPGEQELVIEMYNKGSDYTQVVNGEIVNDVLLNIDHVELDNVDLTQLARDNCLYYPKSEHAPSEVSHCLNLGWNGCWILKFEAPIYRWVLAHD